MEMELSERGFNFCLGRMRDKACTAKIHSLAHCKMSIFVSIDFLFDI
jgi:hypothetical protein